MYEVFLTRKAEKIYDRLDANIRKRVNKCIDQLGVEPIFGRNIAKLEGRLEGYCRYRIGGIRVIYKIDMNDKTVTVMDIASRGDVYKK